MRIIFGSLALAAAVALGPVHAQTVELEGQKYPATTQVGSATLQLNGVGLRKRAIFNVYTAGLYVSTKTQNAAAVIGDTGPRRMELRMLRDVDADTFVDSLTAGLKSNLSDAEMNALKPQIDTLVSTLKAVGQAKKGDTINFDFTPEGGTRIVVNGAQKGPAIPGADFFAAVMKIWLGDKPVDADLKKALLRG